VDSSRKHVTLAARLGIAPSTLNAIVKNRKDRKKYQAKCGRFSGQRRSVKQPQHYLVDHIV
jgi:hypothetical protein